jgi:hypothetical protein
MTLSHRFLQHPAGQAALADLVRRGYVRLSPTLCGPLAIQTGETQAELTEAGRLALDAEVSTT